MAEGSSGADNGNFALIVNCIDNAQSILSDLLRDLTGSPECSFDGDSKPVSWNIDNKYYTGTIQLISCGREGCVQKLQQETERHYEAMVLVCDLKKPDMLNTVSLMWKEVTSQLSQSKIGSSPPAVCCLLLVLDGQTPSEEVRVQEVLNWCVSNGFEMIEWPQNKSSKDQEQDDQDSDTDEIMPDEVGVTRLGQALEAHIWPYIQMKNSTSKSSGKGTSLSHSNGTPSSQPLTSTSSGVESTGTKPADAGMEKLESKALSQDNKDESQKRIDSLLSAEDERLIAEGMGVGDQDPGTEGESFEQLFSRFAQMKEHAQSLPHEERKLYAEKVVMSFWNAIGGDEEEVKVEEEQSN